MTNDQIITALIQVESEGNVNAIGDKGKAFGILQIRQGCLDDFNKWKNTELELQDMLGQSGAEVSKVIFVEYMKHYATELRLGRPVTPTDKARIWNGGPNGWRKQATLSYAAKFNRISDEHGYA